MVRCSPRSRQVLRGASALLGSGVLLALLQAPLTHAAVGCRSDPLIVLNNGMVFDLSTTINDDVSDVKLITYTLHVPYGVSLAQAVSTDGDVKYHEQFLLVNDSQTTTTGTPYTVGVQVTTHTAGITASATIAGGDATTLQVTPQMVGLQAWVQMGNATPPGATGAKEKSKAAKAVTPLSKLPADVTDQLNAWASTAPWTAIVSSGVATISSGQLLSASITL